MNREINKLLYNIINPNDNSFDKKEKELNNKLNKIIYFFIKWFIDWNLYESIWFIYLWLFAKIRDNCKNYW